MEPSITINGIVLTTAQAMTVRVAVQSFAVDLTNNGLGDDELGKGITEGYLAAVRTINSLIAGEAHYGSR